MTEPLRVAVVGVGRWGVNLASTLMRLPGCRVVALCDWNLELVVRVATELAVPWATENYDELLANPDIDAVLLATPPEEHAMQARLALEAGKHVFVEKPLATSLADGLAIERAALSARRLVMAGHLLRYHAGVTALREIVTSGQLGRVRFAVSRRLGWRNADRCGPWWSLAPHDLCVLRGVLQTEPTWIAAACALGPRLTPNPVRALFRGGSHPPPPILRCPIRVLAAVDFEPGIGTLIDVGLLDDSRMRKVVLIGDRAMARFEDGTDGGIWLKPLSRHAEIPVLVPPDPGLTVADATALLSRVDELAEKGEPWQQTPHRWEAPLTQEMRCFVAACADPELARTEMDDALAILRALEAGTRSMRADGRCVRIPEPTPAALSGLELASRPDATG